MFWSSACAISMVRSRAIPDRIFKGWGNVIIKPRVSCDASVSLSIDFVKALTSTAYLCSAFGYSGPLGEAFNVSLDLQDADCMRIGVAMRPEVFHEIPPDQTTGSVTEDRASDTGRCHDVMGARNAHAGFLQRRNATPRKPAGAEAGVHTKASQSAFCPHREPTQDARARCLFAE